MRMVVRCGFDRAWFCYLQFSLFFVWAETWSPELLLKQSQNVFKPFWKQRKGQMHSSVLLNIMYQFYWESAPLLFLRTEIQHLLWSWRRAFFCTCQKLSPLIKHHSSHVFCEDVPRVKMMLWHSCTETAFLHSSCFYPGGKRIRNRSEWSQRSGKLGLSGKVKVKRVSTRPRVWFEPRIKGGGGGGDYYKGMGWDRGWVWTRGWQAG